MNVSELRAMLPSWERALRVQDKSPNTIAMYLTGARAWLDYAEDEGLGPLSRDTLRGFVLYLRQAGRKPGTVRARWAAARRFVKWLVAEDELESDPFTGMDPPQDAEPQRMPLSEAQLSALFKVCEVPKGALELDRFLGRRDEAMLRLFAETGMRASELLSLRVPAEDERTRQTVTVMGKGRRRRTVGYGDRTALALDRYLRSRARQPQAADPALWLGWNRGPLSYNGLAVTLARRAKAAGIEGFHLHRLRHTLADRWLAAGGSERDLMAFAGWTKHDQLAVYTKGRASARAIETARKLNLGDL